MSSIVFENGKYGLRAVLTESWSPEAARELIDKPVAELVLNTSKGWHGDNIEFILHTSKSHSGQSKSGA